jgi:RNA polymerase sigma factor (sigma-70 family)
VDEKKSQYREMALREIKVDHDLQSRVKTSMAVVQDYAEAISGGAVFPPVVVYFDGKDYLLADGFHRHEAFKQAGKNTIPAEVREGSRREAMIFSAGANAKMGHRPMRDDTKKAVRMLLSDPDVLATWSHKDIALHCGISIPTATTYRDQYCFDHDLQIEPRPSRVWGVTAKNGYVPRYSVAVNKGRKEAFLRYEGKSVYLGLDGHEAKQKFEAEKAKIVAQGEKNKTGAVDAENTAVHGSKRTSRIRLGDGGELLMRWLQRRGIDARTTRLPVAVFSVPGAVFVARPGFEDAESLMESVGAVLVGRKAIDDSLKAVIVCYKDTIKFNKSNYHYRSKFVISQAAKMGVEFMTPEELVDSIALLGVEIKSPEELATEILEPDKFLNEEKSSIHVNPLDFDRLVMKKAIEHGADRRAVKDSEQYSDGMMALLEAKQKFDPSLGIPFIAFAAQRVEWAIKGGIRNRKLGTKSGSVNVARFTDMADPEDPESSNFAASVADDTREIDAEDIDVADRLLLVLNVQERRLVKRCVMEGWSLDHVGEEEDPSLGSEEVRKILDRAVEKMREAGGETESA